MRRLSPLLLLAACTTPLAPDEARIAERSAPSAPSATPARATPARVEIVSGAAGLEFTNARIRADLVEPECDRMGLSFGSLSIGKIEDGERAFTATCV